MTRKETLKVYHGIPKSVTDDYTLVYCENESTATDKISTSKYNLLPTLTGYGSSIVDTNLGSKTRFRFKKGVKTNELTIDFLVKFQKPVNSEVHINLLKILNNSTGKGISIYKQWYNILNVATTDQPALAINNYLVDDYNFIRVTINNNVLKLYINGKNVYTLNSYTCPFITELDSCELYCQHAIISDIHISNVDRGEYFPTLPQDFKDKKAILRPRMGQQQIKGDPLFGQETTDLVSITSSKNKPQITCSRTSGNWANGDTIKVKGLGGEVISGVVDSDTALCYVTCDNVRDIDPIPVSDVSKLSVGDKVNLYAPAYSNYLMSNRTITEINVEAKTIKTNPSVTLTGDGKYYYISEITPDSSSPIVKTASGQEVTGVWSNLGTGEATFTLGTNSSLTNQDLYVTYSLNMVNGNSDYTEIPYSIEYVYDEFGNKLDEVTELKIIDDFNGKTLSNTKNCPHMMKSTASSTLQLPSGFKYEVVHYPAFYNDDGFPFEYSTLETNYIAQHLISINVVEMIERKLGEIPSSNKIKWITDNVVTGRFFVKAKGGGFGGNLVKLQMYRNDLKAWETTYTKSHTSTSFQELGIGFLDKTSMGASYNNNGQTLTEDGFAHFILSTNPSNSVNSSILQIDYVYVELTLKTDNSFTHYYTTNTRAREQKCNPIMIKKDTKTLRRYLPSDAPFTTEVSFAPIPNYPDISYSSKSTTKQLSSHSRYFLSSLGTGATRTKIAKEYLNQLLYKYDLHRYIGDRIIEVPYTMLINKSENSDYLNPFTMSELTTNASRGQVQGLLSSVYSTGYKCEQGVSRGINEILNLINDGYEYYGIVCSLYKINNEICLLVSNTPPNFDMSSNVKKCGLSNLYRLPNRPLIK